MQPGILLGVAVGAVGLLLTSTTAVAIAIFCVSFGFLTYLTLRRLVTGSDTAASSRPVAGPKADPGNTELKAELLRRAKERLAQSMSSPPAFEGSEPRPHRVNQLLDHLFEYFVQDYVETWYDLLSPGDPDILGKCKHSFWAVTDGLHRRLEAVDWVTFLTRDVVMILTTHLQTVRLSDASLGHFPTHPALVSDEAEVRYLREMMGVFLACVLPPEDSESAMFTSMTRELLTETIHRNINMLADYDYVNQCIAARGDQLEQELEKKRGKANAFSSQQAILRAIGKSVDAEECEEIRCKIISEMMQIKHLENLKRDATSAEDRVALNQLLAMDPKAAQLKSRNLKRYMHELRQVKRECERRLAQLGGPDYRTAESGSREQAGGHTDGGRSPDQLGERQPKGSLTKIIGSIGGTIGNIGGTIKGTLKEVMVLENIEDASHADSSLISLPEIIGSIGLGYFMEYLRKMRAVKNIKFWISCNTLLKVAETDREVQCGLVRNVYQVVTTRAEDKSQLELKKSTLDAINKLISRCCGHGCDSTMYCPEKVPRTELVALVRAQREVYRYLYENHYRKFVFSDEYSEYIRKNATANRRGMPKEGPGPDGSFDPALGPGVLALWYNEAVGEERYDRSRIAEADAEASFAEDDWCTEWSRWRATVIEVHPLNSVGSNGTASSGAISPDDGTFMVDISVTVSGQDDGECKVWCTTRTAAEFTALHNQLSPLSESVPLRPPWIDGKSRWGVLRDIVSSPKAPLERIPSPEVLQAYLQSLLQDPVIKESEALFTFLKKSERPESRSRVRRNSRQTPPNVTPTSPMTQSPMDDEDPDQDPSLEDDERDSIAEPMYGLISEIFVLKGLFKWLRRQAIFFVKLTYGASINTYVETSIGWLSEEEQLVYYLEYFRDTMFPQEWTPPPPRTEDEKHAMQEYAQEKLRAIIVDAVSNVGLIGNRNALRGADALFSALQSTHTNKHLMYTILEKFMEHLLPEITPRILAQNLVTFNGSE